MGSPAEPKDTAKTGEIQRGTSSSRGLLNFKLKVVKMPKDGRKRKRRNRRKTKPAEPPKLTAIEEYIQSLEGYEQGIPTPIIFKYFLTSKKSLRGIKGKALTVSPRRKNFKPRPKPAIASPRMPNHSFRK